MVYDENLTIKDYKQWLKADIYDLRKIKARYLFRVMLLTVVILSAVTLIALGVKYIFLFNISLLMPLFFIFFAALTVIFCIVHSEHHETIFTYFFNEIYDRKTASDYANEIAKLKYIVYKLEAGKDLTPGDCAQLEIIHNYRPK